MIFLMRNQYTNIILINALHRFDLGDSSCVNEEVKVFNRKLSNIAKSYENISIANVELKSIHSSAMGYI
jgi:hypothetical protein